MHPGASGERGVEVRRASQGSSSIGDERVVEGLRRSRCIKYEALEENGRRNLENGAMHRARVGVYSGILRVRMRQRNLGLGEDAVYVGEYFRFNGDYGRQEQPRSGKSGVEAWNQSRTTHAASVEAERLRGAWDLFGRYFGLLLVFSCCAYPFYFIL